MVLTTMVADAPGAASRFASPRRDGALLLPRLRPLQKIEGHVVKSPMVGTFYRAPSPGAKAFVEVGDKRQSPAIPCASSRL